MTKRFCDRCGKELGARVSDIETFGLTDNVDGVGVSWTVEVKVGRRDLCVSCIREIVKGKGA